MLAVVKSFHEGMHAEARIGSDTTEKFEVRNGLRQGCTIAPLLFNIYFSGVVANWRGEWAGEGVNVLYKIGRKLVGDRTAKSRLKEARVTETQFADDTALYSMSSSGFVALATGFVATAKDWGLTVSTTKTKAMIVDQSLHESDMRPVQVDGGAFDIVDSFTYLGSNISRDGEAGTEVSLRLAKAARAFGCLRRSVFQDRNLSIDTKWQVYHSVVLSVLLYGAEAWTLKAKDARRLEAFHNRCIRSILGVSRFEQWKE